MSILYRHFSKGWSGLDYSDQALLDMYNSESYGVDIKEPMKNGFYVGKQWMGVNISMWKEDRKNGHLVLSELYDDDHYPHWWLDKIFNT